MLGNKNTETRTVTQRLCVRAVTWVTVGGWPDSGSKRLMKEPTQSFSPQDNAALWRVSGGFQGQEKDPGMRGKKADCTASCPGPWHGFVERVKEKDGKSIVSRAKASEKDLLSLWPAFRVEPLCPCESLRICDMLTYF